MTQTKVCELTKLTVCNPTEIVQRDLWNNSFTRSYKRQERDTK